MAKAIGTAASGQSNGQSIVFVKEERPHPNFYYGTYEAYVHPWQRAVKVPFLPDGVMSLGGGLDIFQEIKAILHEAYPLPNGFEWGASLLEFGVHTVRPEPVRTESTASLIFQHRQDEIWFSVDPQGISSGLQSVEERMQVRNRNRLIDLTVKESCRHGKFAWVRGQWNPLAKAACSSVD